MSLWWVRLSGLKVGFRIFNLHEKESVCAVVCDDPIV